MTGRIINNIVSIALLSLLIFILYLRYVGIDSIDLPVEKFINSYPILSGGIIVTLGLLGFQLDYKEYKKEPVLWRKVFCIRSAALVLFGLLGALLSSS